MMYEKGMAAVKNFSSFQPALFIIKDMLGYAEQKTLRVFLRAAVLSQPFFTICLQPKGIMIASNNPGK